MALGVERFPLEFHDIFWLHLPPLLNIPGRARCGSQGPWPGGRFSRFSLRHSIAAEVMITRHLKLTVRT